MYCCTLHTARIPLLEINDFGEQTVLNSHVREQTVLNSHDSKTASKLASGKKVWRGREEGRKGGRQGGRQGGREGGREEGREEGREDGLARGGGFFHTGVRRRKYKRGSMN
jgi:flagellar biosynthesis/type III secretory pathway protein FliH